MKQKIKPYMKVSYIQSEVLHNNTEVIIDKDKDIDRFISLLIELKYIKGGIKMTENKIRKVVCICGRCEKPFKNKGRTQYPKSTDRFIRCVEHNKEVKKTGQGEFICWNCFKEVEIQLRDSYKEEVELI